MGQLIDGKWEHDRSIGQRKDGAFVRKAVQFRDHIERGGKYPPTPGRYHLYVSYACPWANRTLIFRSLKGLEEAVGVSIVDPRMFEDGWVFSDNPGCVPDTVLGKKFMYEIYTEARSDYTGRVTVPVLWDKETGTIVNNESSEIIRMFNSEFAEVASADSPDYYPSELRSEIDAINEVVYDNVNNGVYKCGFARTQEAYDKAFEALFATLEDLEARLGKSRYLVGDRITEADWRLFTTLVRFDPVYATHFKCNKKRLLDYPNLLGYTRELYQVPGVAETVDMDHIKIHYYESHTSINPTSIVARGFEIDLTAPHGRG